jgi:hypothetical protein
VRHAAHGIVGYACWDGAADPGRVGEEGIEAPVAALRVLEPCVVGVIQPMSTYIVEININAAVVRKNEVPYRIGALDWVLVAVESLEEPGVSGLQFSILQQYELTAFKTYSAAIKSRADLSVHSCWRASASYSSSTNRSLEPI